MNFFCTKKDFEIWIKNMDMENDEDIYCLDINDAIKASYEIFDV